MTVDYNTIAKNLKFEGRAFINGKYVDAIDGEKFENINPATGEVLCAVSKCNHKDVDLAVKVSRKAFNSGVWSRTSPEFRKDVLLKFANFSKTSFLNSGDVLDQTPLLKAFLETLTARSTSL